MKINIEYLKFFQDCVMDIQNKGLLIHHNTYIKTFENEHGKESGRLMFHFAFTMLNSNQIKTITCHVDFSMPPEGDGTVSPVNFLRSGFRRELSQIVKHMRMIR